MLCIWSQKPPETVLKVVKFMPPNPLVRVCYCTLESPHTKNSVSASIPVYQYRITQNVCGYRAIRIALPLLRHELCHAYKLRLKQYTNT